ncbi:hypothetical protein AVEN_17424-1 [Araneus ventricosus]|uniref:Uncharacterized protein n=1 Tax=Araneus ventricosus TaxID=182803 RepID=A0A4Y2GZ94_ARAVE|nr:hypothetical protein AVEN_17424-1 [Araneus ventricosus]
MQFLPSFQGLPKPTKNLNEYCGWTLNRRDTLFQWPKGLLDGCNILEKHLEMIGRSKELDWTEMSVQFLRAVVIAYASWFVIRPPAVRLVELRRQ